MMPAAKALDPLLGIDIHIMQPPGPVPPVPLPNPYIGMVFDPMDFVPFLGATTRIAGLPRAQAGSAGQALPPHLPIGGVFVKPPSNESEIFMGSAIVSIDGDAASYMALPVLSCVCVGMPAIPRLKKKKKTVSLVLPLTKVLAIPSPVFIGGPPTISLTAMAGRAGLGNLLLLKSFIESGGDPMILLGLVAGKLMGKLQGLANKGLGKLIGKIGGKAKGKGKGKARPPKGKQGKPRGNGAKCNGLHPVDTVTGEMFDDFLDAKAGGEALFEWSRRFSSAMGHEFSVCGWGFRHSYAFKLELFAQAYRLETYQREVYYFTPVPDVGDVSVTDGYVMLREASDRITIARPGRPTLHFAVSSQHAPRLVLLSAENRRLLLEYSGEQLVGLQEGRLQNGMASVLARYLLQYYPNGLLYSVYRIEEPTTGAATPGYTPLARYEYDTTGRVIRSTNALGGEYLYHYDRQGRLAQLTDPRGYAFTWQYDAFGRCIESTGQDGLWRGKLQYFAGETHIQECSTSAHIHRYDSAGTIVEVQDPYGGVQLRERDPATGRVVREVDSGGRSTEWLYGGTGDHYARRNQYGQLLPPEELDGEAPDPHAPQLPLTDAAREWGFEPDELAAFGPSTLLLGDVALETARALVAGMPRPSDAKAFETVQRYNGRGDLVEEVEPSGRRRTWEYDACGNVLSYRDADGKVFRQEIVRWNLLGAEVDPLGNTIRHQFTDNELVAATTDALGNVTSYEYDEKDRLVRVRRQGALQDEYVYDLGDRIVEQRDGAGNVLLKLEHDKRSMVNKVVLADGSEQQLGFDEHGLPTLASTNAHEVLITRDDAGHVTSELVDGLGVTMSHAGDVFTLFDRFRFRRWSYGRSVSSTSSKDLVVWQDATQRKHRLRIDPTGLVRRETPAGTVELARFDDSGRVDARVVEWRTGGGRPRAWVRSYERSAEGDLLAIADSMAGSTGYRVDDAHRLTLERGASGSYDYVLDPAGNVLQKPGLRGVVIGPHNTIVQANGRRFQHDVRGHVSEAFDPATGQTLRYRYDARDMLTSIETGHLDGTTWVPDLEPWTAEYDSLGRRLTSGRGAQLQRYYWRDNQLMAEVAATGELRIYLYAHETTWVPLSFVDYPSIEADPASGKAYSVFGDHLGMPLCVEDETGAVVWRARRVDPFGQIEVEPGNTIELNLRWPGHYHDPETGLFYNRYRYYDPTLGRYLQADPIGQSGGINVYAYAPNPLRDVDLLGLHNGPKASRSGKDKGGGGKGKGAAGAKGKSKPKPRAAQPRGSDGKFGRKPPGTTGRRQNERVATKKPRSTDAKLSPRNKNVKERKAAKAREETARTNGDKQGEKAAKEDAKKATERIGADAADASVKSDYPDAKKIHSGEGPNTFDAVHERPDGAGPPKYIVSEAKGGTADNSGGREGLDGQQVQQGTPEYRDAVADKMAKSPDKKTRDAGKKLQNAAPGDIEYREVSQPLDSAGNPTDMKVSEYGPSKAP
jgi:RHS repeat-associated protein